MFATAGQIAPLIPELTGEQAAQSLIRRLADSVAACAEAAEGTKSDEGWRRAYETLSQSALLAAAELRGLGVEETPVHDAIATLYATAVLARIAMNERENHELWTTALELPRMLQLRSALPDVEAGEAAAGEGQV